MVLEMALNMQVFCKLKPISKIITHLMAVHCRIQVAWGILEADGEFCYPPSTTGIVPHCAAMRKKQHTKDQSQIFVELVKAGAGRYWSQKGALPNDHCHAYLRPLVNH